MGLKVHGYRFKGSPVKYVTLLTACPGETKENTGFIPVEHPESARFNRTGGAGYSPGSDHANYYF
jgi:hypothetical protein